MKLLLLAIALLFPACCDPCPTGYAYFQGSCLYVIVPTDDVDGGSD